jgi:hypothetical protein
MNKQPMSLGRRWQEWRRTFALTGARSEESREQKLERAALELGLSTDELCNVCLKAYYTTNLMPLRMALQRLDPAEVAHSNPQLFSHLEKSCKLCEVKGQCAFDMTQNPANPHWQEYCPNAPTLREMRARNTS